MLREKPGNVVVLSGRNAGKIERVGAAVEAGLNVLVDKPWILASADLPKLASALDDRRAEEAGRLRHHDRALRSLERAAARAGHGPRGVRRDRPGHARRARRLHRERAPPDEGGVGRAQHPPDLVLRRLAAGRGPQRHRHAPRRPRAVDAVARARRRRQDRRQGARRLSLADDDPGSRLQARHRHRRLPRRAEGRASRTARSSTSATPSSPTRCAACTSRST